MAVFKVCEDGALEVCAYFNKKQDKLTMSYFMGVFRVEFKNGKEHNQWLWTKFANQDGFSTFYVDQYLEQLVYIEVLKKEDIKDVE